MVTYPLTGRHVRQGCEVTSKSFQMPGLSYGITEMGRDQINDINVKGHPLCSIAVCPHSGLGQAAGLFGLTAL